ncbi:MAG: ABC transporter permease [Alphaproteobacteria bacterium]|nr:ABC transporter permease [Alphaproteobacteria bacterium]
MEMYEAIILTIITAATPLLLAACGELVAERAGVLNLGVEGMMIMGAVAAFAVAFSTGSPYLGIAAGIAAGAAASLPFAFLTISMVTNQVATGLALTILGLGLSGMIGDAYIGQPGVKLTPISIEGLSDLPYVGKILFSQDVIVYASVLLLLIVWFFLFKTRAGLSLRAVGDSHSSAHALGVSVRKVRYLAVIFGGACAGLAGAYLSLVYTPQWTEGMTAGRGWIAVVLVVFATWMPGRLLAGAYLFGAVLILQLHAQAAGVNIPSQFLSSLPYLATIIVLVLISRNRTLVKKNSPACLGKPFVPDV